MEGAVTEEPRRIRLEYDERRDAILAAAQRLFAHRPYDAVSTSEVARIAGTTRTNVHYYFGTKRNLYLEVIARFASLPLPVQSDPARLSRREAIDDLFGRWLDLVEENEETFLVLMRTQSTTLDPEIAAVLERSLRAWENRLLRLLGLPASNLRARAMIRSFQAMISAACDQWLRAGTLGKEDVRSLLTNSLLAVGDLLR
jgi:AcrR family transcriptional regulator